MNRTQKLYERLDQIEAQYAALLCKELESVLRGGLGHYLGRKLRDDWQRAICRPPDERTLELERLEKEILRLRSKLHEPLPGPIVAMAHALVRRIQDAGQWSPGTNKAWLSEVLSKIAEGEFAND
jgi:hypothetical protein